jgi:hypothetical protein
MVRPIFTRPRAKAKILVFPHNPGYIATAEEPRVVVVFVAPGSAGLVMEIEEPGVVVVVIGDAGMGVEI